MDAFPEFKLLRMLYHAVEVMYEKDTLEEAEAAWDEWQELLPPANEAEYSEWCDLYSVDQACFESFRSLSRGGFTQFKPYVLNYFKPGCRETNAATEGLNNLIGRINISGNGYKFKHLRAKALYSSLFYTRVTYMLDMNSVKPWKPAPKGMQDITIGIPPRVIFSSREEDCSIVPVNVLHDNSGLDKLLAGNGDTVSGSLPEVDPDDILNVTEEDFVLMRLSNWSIFF